MANTYKNIVITPNTSVDLENAYPSIVFSGGDKDTNTDIILRVTTLSNGTISFEGSAGQLFSIVNDLGNTLFSVNDVSGIPSFEIDANGLISLAHYGGNVGIGTANAQYRLDVSGMVNVSNGILISGLNVMPTIAASFDQANLVWDSANSNYTFAANTVRLIANAAYAAGNSNYTFAANTVRLIANTAYGKANSANVLARAAIIQANTVWDSANSNYTFAANTVRLIANSAYGEANTVNVGNTTSGTWTPRSKRRAINFIEGDGITITVDDDATLNVANVTINSTATGGASVAVSGSAPESPTANSLWWNSEIGKMFVYYADGDTNQWVEITQGLKGGGGGGGGGATVDVSDTAPSSPTANSLWWNSDNGKLYIYYDDGDTEQWVETYPGEVLANGTSEAAAAAAAAYNYANTINSATIAYIIDGGGSAITTGTKGIVEVPFDFQIMRWTIMADQSGTANIDMWSRDWSTTLPTQANSMTDNIGITLSSATANQSSDIDNWRMTTINKDNVISYNVYSSSTITRATVSLFGYKV